MRRAAIYARVSTTDRGQDPETQLRQLREYASRRGFAVAEEFVDHASGTRTDRERFKRLFDAARRRQFDVVLVWRYDRFARSMRELVNALEEFNGLGIDFISYNEGADTTTPQGKLLFGIMASLAEFERSLIADRVKAGMQRAKAQGKHTGRPALPSLTRAKIERLLEQEPALSLRAMAREAGVSVQTVANVRDGQQRRSKSSAFDLKKTSPR
jgi:DNA invertase Pin-like site-specific DNA recombinase